MSAQSSIKLLGFSGSLRKQSYNSGALRAIPALLPDGMSFDVADLLALPFYSAMSSRPAFRRGTKSFEPRLRPRTR